MTSAATDRRDRGEATTQLVILTPILITLIFLGVQAAIYFHAANVAAAAAAQGAAAASPRSATPSDGVAAAAALLADLGADPAGPPSVDQTGGTISVTVTVVVPSIVPFFPDTVARTANEPRERFVPESER